MLKMSVYPAQAIQSSPLSTWNECSTHTERETNARLVPPSHILKDTGRSHAAAAAATRDAVVTVSGLGAQLPDPFLSCLTWTVKAEVQGQGCEM